MQLVHHRRFANARIPGHEHQLRRPARHDAFEGAWQCVDLARASIQFFGNDEPVGRVVFGQCERVDPLFGLPLRKTPPQVALDGRREIVLIELRVIVDQIRSLTKSIAELDKTIGEEGSKLEGHKSLTSIKGIGKITGAILLSVIGNVDDFPDESRLASYFGSVPRVSKLQ